MLFTDSASLMTAQLILSTSCILSVIPATTRAQTDRANPEIVVTATRDAQPVSRTPYYTTTISARDFIEDYEARTVPEALKRQTGIMVQKTAHGQGSPFIRGFTGFRNVMLIDGVRLNNSTFRDGPNQYWNTIDQLSLSRIEIVRGPFSALYGSDAVGGTVECISRGAQDLPPDKSHLADLSYRYSTAEDSHIGRLGAVCHAGKAVISAGFSGKEFGDLEGGNHVGNQPKTGYTEQDWDLKLEYFTDDDSRIVVCHQGINMDDAWRTHKTIYGINWRGTTIGNELKRSMDQDRRLTYAQFHKVNIEGAVDEVHCGVSHHMQAEEQYRARTGDRYDLQGVDVNTLGAFLQLKSITAAGDLVYGLDFYHDDVDSFNHTLRADGSIKKSALQGPVADDAAYDTAAVFLQDIFKLNDSISILAGGRYEHSAVDADKVLDPATGGRTSISESWDSIVGNGRILYSIDEKGAVKLFAGVSQGFRAPNLSDLTRLDSARTDEIETPAPGLDPEKFVSYETGTKIETAGFSAQFALFHTDMRDTIVRTPTGRLIDEEREVTKANAGDGYVHGLEIQAEYRLLEKIKLFGGFTCSYGEVEGYPTSDPVRVKEPLSKLMPPAGFAGIRWSATDSLWVEASCDAAGKADKLSEADREDTSRIPPGGTPGYAVCHLRAGWKLFESTTLSAAVENIADKDYRIHGSGVNEPGRNFILAAHTSF